MPDLFDIVTSRIVSERIGNIPLLGFLEDSLQGWPRWIKRFIDLVGSSLGLVVLAPFFAVIAVMIKLTSKGPVFFTQTRLGKNGKPFVVYKFRTMKVGAEFEKEKLQHLNEARGPLFKIREDPRLTKIGGFLRRSSIDELPQLFNVLLGQMSLVGPRPPLPHEFEKYELWQRKRLQATPGITGLWQVRGRSLLPFEEMVKLDIYYLENWSLWLDIKILLKTVWAVVTGRGAY